MKATLTLIALLGATSAAAGPGSRIEDLALDDLLDMETELATTTPMAPRELPAIITVFHRDELLRSGARDVLDVLQRVPGVQVAHDVEGVLGLATRGRWSAEGRVLMLIDGQPFTEPMYGSSIPEGRIPLHLVQRIEILRGAASTRHGGGASAAVINIVTVAGDGMDGVSVQAEACVRPGGMGCASVSGSVVVTGEKARYAAHAYGGFLTISEGEYEDFWGSKADMGDQYVAPLGLAMHVTRGDSRLHIGAEAQNRRQLTAYDEILEEPTPNNFQTAWIRGTTRSAVAASWTLTPEAEISLHRPWSVEGKADPLGYVWYDRALLRAGSSVGLLGELGDHAQLDLGAGAHVDWIRSGPQWEVFPLPTERRSAVYGTGFTRAELLWVGDRVNFSTGVRAEYAAPAGFRWAPRVALTSTGEHFHAKLLVSGAARAPTYEQVFANPDLEAEQGIEGEIELGARPTDELRLRANVYASKTFNPIVYTIIDDWDSYWNAEPSTTMGTEMQATYVGSRLGIDLVYSHYSRVGTDDPYWQAPGHDNRRAALAPDTASAQIRWSPVERLWISPTARVLGPRTVWAGVTEDEEIFAQDLPTATLLDLAVRIEDIGDQVDLTISAHDLLGQDPGWHQPFEGWHAPLPGRGRELVVRIGWRR